MTIAWRGFLVLLVLLCSWQALTRNLSEFYLQRAYYGSETALGRALWWHEHPDAVALRARRALGDAEAAEDSDRRAAIAGLKRALALAPTGARSAATLARLYGEAQGEAQEETPSVAPTVPLAALADRLGPADWRAQLELARLYAGRGDLAAAVPHLVRAMVGDGAVARSYFPALEQIAADPQTRELLAPVADDPRAYPWWNGFFRYLARDAESLEALRGAVALREAARAFPLEEFERNEYVQRLRRDGLLTEAYLYWVNGLPRDDLEALGYVYDGGFQRAFDNDSGFGWYASPPRNSGIRISRSDTYGASGDSALRLSFRGRRVRFSHVWQHVFLPPGDYVVSGRVRPDKLRARRGLQWRLYCSAGDAGATAGTLGESELFSGTGDWRDFAFAVTVPASGCLGQTLRLYSAGNRVVDHELAGTIWFDDLRIELQR